MIHITTFSSLYPNAAQPRHGLFVEQRLRQLLASGQVTSDVVAPIPWFPLKSPRFGDYARFAAAPAEEQRHGIDLIHPRYPVIPKVGMSIAPALMARFCLPAVRRLLRCQPEIALIDAHYFYPDGVAAAHIAQRLNRPVVITARGSDINVITQFPGPRRQILRAAASAAAIITVSDALRVRLIELGADPARIVVLRNGVDHEKFFPLDRDAARAAAGVAGTMLLSVGNLIELKGHHLAIEALRSLPGYELVIAGHGPDRSRLEQLAQQLGVDARVRFTGSIGQLQLQQLYGAADALVLASSREGMANVLLESLACGTPIVATAVSGTPEVVAAPAAGVLMRERSAGALVEAVKALMSNRPLRADTLAYARQFSWAETTDGQIELFRKIVHDAAR